MVKELSLRLLSIELVKMCVLGHRKAFGGRFSKIKSIEKHIQRCGRNVSQEMLWPKREWFHFGLIFSGVLQSVKEYVWSCQIISDWIQPAETVGWVVQMNSVTRFDLKKMKIIVGLRYTRSISTTNRRKLNKNLTRNNLRFSIIAVAPSVAGLTSWVECCLRGNSRSDSVRYRSELVDMSVHISWRHWPSACAQCRHYTLLWCAFLITGTQRSFSNICCYHSLQTMGVRRWLNYNWAYRHSVRTLPIGAAWSLAILIQVLLVFLFYFRWFSV